VKERIVIRPASRDDLPDLVSIQGASLDAAHWEPGSYLAYDCQVAVVEGTVAGFLVSRRTAPDEHEILNMAVGPSYRRRGVARGLLEHVLGASAGAWFLEVRESNIAALNLYKQFGFRETGRRGAYYENPCEAAIVMRVFSCYRRDAVVSC
jgi:ribosomal-protein-alanine N-acetyltransferase